MAKVSKAQKAQAERIEQGKVYEADEALSLVRELAGAKFAESFALSG